MLDHLTTAHQRQHGSVLSVRDRFCRLLDLCSFSRGCVHHFRDRLAHAQHYATASSCGSSLCPRCCLVHARSYCFSSFDHRHRLSFHACCFYACFRRCATVHSCIAPSHLQAPGHGRHPETRILSMNSSSSSREGCRRRLICPTCVYAGCFSWTWYRHPGPSTTKPRACRCPSQIACSTWCLATDDTVHLFRPRW